jgi:hypothetical protein
MITRQKLAISFDRIITSRVFLFDRTLPAFQLCGYVGLALAIALTQALV